MTLFRVRQGLPSGEFIVRAIQALQQQGYPENDRTMLHLKMAFQAIRTDMDDASHNREQLLNLEPLLQKHGYLDLLYWLYELLDWLVVSSISFRENLEASRTWRRKSYDIALGMEDETLMKAAEVYLLWNQVLSGLEDETLAVQLEELRSHFAPHYSNSFVYFVILGALQIINTANGFYEQAILYGKQRLHIATEWQDLLWISVSFGYLADTYWQMGLTDQAKLQYLDILEWNLAIGQEWQTLGFLPYILLDSDLYNNRELGVTVLSAVYHHPENLSIFNRRIEEGLPPLQEELGAEVFNAAWEKGKGLDFDTAVALFRIALQSGT
ncbi:MAG: hypothetical protein KDE48_15315 [Anaerolineales bacterium]|nr:hypothetical protein [Anaerolineales bacterium]